MTEFTMIFACLWRLEGLGLQCSLDAAARWIQAWI
jgi:hypothetical protein